MSLSHRRKLGFLCLIAALLFPRPVHAEQEGETLWDKGAAELMELAEKARHLKISIFLPSPGKPVDVSALEQKLDELKENIDYAKNPPPGIGAFFDQRRSTVVSQLLINGPAERGGINIGDEFLQVNGHDVSDSMGIGHWAGQASAPIEITLKGRQSKVVVTKKIPELLSPGLLKEIEDEFKAVKTATADLKRKILSPESNAIANTAISREIDARISRLSDKLLDAQTKLYRKA